MFIAVAVLQQHVESRLHERCGCLLLPFACASGFLPPLGMQQLLGLTGLQRLQLHNCMKVHGGKMSVVLSRETPCCPSLTTETWLCVQPMPWKCKGKDGMHGPAYEWLLSTGDSCNSSCHSRARCSPGYIAMRCTHSRAPAAGNTINVAMAPGTTCRQQLI